MALSGSTNSSTGSTLFYANAASTSSSTVTATTGSTFSITATTSANPYTSGSVTAHDPNDPITTLAGLYQQHMNGVAPTHPRDDEAIKAHYIGECEEILVKEAEEAEDALEASEAHIRKLERMLRDALKVAGEVAYVDAFDPSDVMAVKGIASDKLRRLEERFARAKKER